MNKRTVITVALSVTFIVLLVTGLLLYSTAYDYFTSSLHTLTSLFLLLLLSLHFANNWNVYRNHLGKLGGKLVFIFTALCFLPLSYLLIAEKWPASAVVEFGEKLRSSGKVRDGEFEVIDLAGDNAASGLTLFVKAGLQYRSDPQPLFLGFTYTATPQMAVWLESLSGEFVRTLYVTHKISNSGFQSASLDQDQVIRRPEALPYWGHRRGVQSADGLYLPEAGSMEFDGLSAATPKGDHQLIFAGSQTGAYRLLVEVNRSYDFNDYYSRDRFPDDAIYSGSGSSGQPSLVYEAEIDMALPGEQLLKLIGHGHHSGKDGSLSSDLSGVTTARDIFSFIVAKVQAQ